MAEVLAGAAASGAAAAASSAGAAAGEVEAEDSIRCAGASFFSSLLEVSASATGRGDDLAEAGAGLSSSFFASFPFSAFIRATSCAACRWRTMLWIFVAAASSDRGWEGAAAPLGADGAGLSEEEVGAAVLSEAAEAGTSAGAGAAASPAMGVAVGDEVAAAAALRAAGSSSFFSAEDVVVEGGGEAAAGGCSAGSLTFALAAGFSSLAADFGGDGCSGALLAGGASLVAGCGLGALGVSAENDSS